MKTSLTKLSSSLFFVTLSWSVFATPVAQVVGLSGTVFALSPEGKTTVLKANQHIEDKTEVMVEEGASITLNDYYDATYHLTGGSHLKFYNKSVQLKKGKAWIQSLSSRHPLAITTANGYVDFWKGEFIATFDQGSNRSQILVVNGEVEVSNVLDRNMKYTVSAGQFTMVDPDVENGIPRVPTKVGLQSLNQALSEFKQLPEKIKTTEQTPTRAIASVNEVPKGEIIFITSHRMPASVSTKVAKKYFKKLARSKTSSTQVPIKTYGMTWLKTAPSEAIRTPASVRGLTPKVPTVVPQIIKNDPEFTDSLKKQEDEQPKHPKNLQSLIDDLKSY